VVKNVLTAFLKGKHRAIKQFVPFYSKIHNSVFKLSAFKLKFSLTDFDKTGTNLLISYSLKAIKKRIVFIKEVNNKTNCAPSQLVTTINFRPVFKNSK